MFVGMAVIGVICLGLSFLVFILDEFCCFYSSFWDFVSEDLLPIFISIGLALSLLGGIGALINIASSEEGSQGYYDDEYTRYIECLEKNPFDEELLEDIIDWNAIVEQEELKNKDSEVDNKIALEKIDYKAYQREYAIKVLSMSDEDLKNDSSTYRISEKEIVQLNKYIQSLIDENNELRDEIENLTSSIQEDIKNEQEDSAIKIDKDSGKIIIPQTSN